MSENRENDRRETPECIRATAMRYMAQFIELLNNGKYRKINDDFGIPAAALKQAKSDMSAFGSMLTPSPDNALEIFPTITEGHWAFVYDVWVDNEESDISIEGWLVRSGSDISIEIEDIHML